MIHTPTDRRVRKKRLVRAWLLDRLVHRLASRIVRKQDIAHAVLLYGSCGKDECMEVVMAVKKRGQEKSCVDRRRDGKARHLRRHLLLDAQEKMFTIKERCKSTKKKSVIKGYGSRTAQHLTH